MAKLDNQEILSIKEYIRIYHSGKLTIPAICYAIRQDRIDYIQPQRERFIVLTEKTLNYKPRKDKCRNE